MTDLSKVSDADLMAAIAQQAQRQSATNDLASVSDADLMAALNHVGYAEDVGKSIGGGAGRGAAGVAGLPGGLGHAADWLTGQTAGRVTNYLKNGSFDAKSSEDVAKLRERVRADLPLPELPSPDDALTYDNAKGAIEKVTGPLYEPKTVPGQYANTISEFAVGSLGGGPGNVLQRGINVAVPAITSETAGQVTKGTAAEPYARIGGALLGGGAAALATSPRTPHSAISNSLRGIDQTTMVRAEAIMQDAASQGVRLTWDEAIAAANNGITRLTDLRRVVENSGGGGAIREVMNNRPAELQAAGDVAVGGLSPNRLPPTQAGLRAQRAATDEVGAEQAAINAQTRPLYQSVEAVPIDPVAHQALMSDPLFAQTLREVRNDPALNRTVGHLPDNSVGVVDLVQRRMREAAAAAQTPGQAHTSNLRATNIEDARTGAVQAAEAATGGATGPYAQARQTQADLRQNVLEPLNEGPLGQISRTNDIQAQGRTILPNAPAHGSEAEIADTVRRLARRDPQAVENVVHTHVRGVFDEAMQDIASGPNAFGGAKFAAAIAGNTQQARNLEAAVRALPNGNARWEGFNRFLETARATGNAPRQGSATAFNQEIQQGLSGGGKLRAVGQLAASGGTAITRIVSDFFSRMNLGRNTEEIARILTDRRAGPLLAQLARAPAGSGRAARLTASVILLTNAASNSGSNSRQPVP